jgi:hypothetical protein
MQAFVCEKEISVPEFEPWGIIDKFRAFGWEATFKCYDRLGDNLFADQLQQWMATLRCPPYTDPTKMRLIGSVDDVPIEMSFATLSRVAKFDSRPVSEYIIPSMDSIFEKPDLHPRWREMLEYLFEPGTTTGKLLKKDLKIEAKIFFHISLNNIMPRRGDRNVVRNQDVPVLYALMTGTQKFPYRWLVMQNIWISRNSYERAIVPHCRLITALFRIAKVLEFGDKGNYKKFEKFDSIRIGKDWKQRESDRFLMLRSAEKQRWRVLKPGARPLVEGEEEEDEPEWSDEAVSEEEAYQHDPYTHENRDGASGSAMNYGTQSGYIGSAFDYAQRDYEPNWAHIGSMGEVVAHQRPDFFGEWNPPTQMAFDHQTFLGASMERAQKQMYDRMENWNRAQMYAREEEINRRYLDDLDRRRYEAWLAGRPFIHDPPRMNYANLPEFDGTVVYPTPPLHHSQWLDPHSMGGSGSSQQGGTQDDAGGSGAFGFGEFSEMMTSIFGPPLPRQQ